jgi:hypothetical protein
MKLLMAVVLALTPAHSEMRYPRHCPQHATHVVRAGFNSEMATALRVMHKESRCIPTVFNGADPNGGSIGLFQINMFWCKPSRYFKDGWLQTQGIVRNCDDLYDPWTNMVAAKAIYDYSVEHNDGNGWQPWGL